jgi:hypothetical protein
VRLARAFCHSGMEVEEVGITLNEDVELEVRPKKKRVSWAPDDTLVRVFEIANDSKAVSARRPVQRGRYRHN